MPEGRPPIPAAVKREVLVEAGHRRAIPTCRQRPVEIAHIDPYRKVRAHAAENLIALCPTCHARYDNGKDIDRTSMRQYSARSGPGFGFRIAPSTNTGTFGVAVCGRGDLRKAVPVRTAPRLRVSVGRRGSIGVRSGWAGQGGRAEVTEAQVIHI